MRLQDKVAIITGASLEQIIEAAIFLVSSASDGVTGAILPVQGKGI